MLLSATKSFLTVETICGRGTRSTTESTARFSLHFVMKAKVGKRWRSRRTFFYETVLVETFLVVHLCLRSSFPVPWTERVPLSTYEHRPKPLRRPATVPGRRQERCPLRQVHENTVRRSGFPIN